VPALIVQQNQLHTHFSNKLSVQSQVVFGKFGENGLLMSRMIGLFGLIWFCIFVVLGIDL
jgi:preprotein translocase subunit SecG